MFNTSDLVLPDIVPAADIAPWLTLLVAGIALALVLIAYKAAKRIFKRRAKAFITAAAIAVISSGLGIGAISLSTADAANTAKQALEAAQAQTITDWAHNTYGVDVNPSDALDLIAGHPVTITVNGATQKVTLSTDVGDSKLTVANNELPTIG